MHLQSTRGTPLRHHVCFCILQQCRPDAFPPQRAVDVQLVYEAKARIAAAICYEGPRAAAWPVKQHQRPSVDVQERYQILRHTALYAGKLLSKYHQTVSVTAD